MNDSQITVNSTSPTSIITIGGCKKHWESLKHYWRRVIDREEGFRVERTRKTTSISAIAVVVVARRALSMTLTTSCRENATGLMLVGG